MDISLTARSGLKALAAGLAAAILVGVALLTLAGFEARDDVKAAGADLAESARAATSGATPPGERAAQEFLVAGGLTSARIASSDGAVLATRGPAARWGAAPAGARAWFSTLGADGWSLRTDVLEARASFRDGGTLLIRTNRRPSHGEIGGLLPIAVAALLVGLLAAGLQFRAARRTGSQIGALTAAVAALPARPVGSLPSGGRWSATRREVRRAASRWGTAARRRPDELAVLLAPLDHPAATLTTSGGRTDNPALAALRSRLSRADGNELSARLAAMFAQRGPCADRVPVGADDHLDIEAWDCPAGRIAVVTDRREADRLDALRRRISGAARRHLTAPLIEIRRQAGILSDRDVGAEPLRITASADRLEALIERMLREGDAPGAGAAVIPVGLPGLLWGMARRWDDALRSRALRVELEFAAGLPRVQADPALLDEILGELVDNAARFSPRGSAITLVAEASDESVVLSVRDGGPGFSPADTPAAREPFWRADDAEAMPGAGLGLGVADALAQRMGARLGIEAGPGGCVRLTLPEAPAAADEIAA